MQRSTGILSHIGALGRWYTILILLMAENLGHRHRRSRLSSLFAIIEPLAIVAIVSAAHSLVAQMPVYGTSSILFYASGVLPFFLCVHVSVRARSMENWQQFPRVTEFDILISHLLDELLLKSIVIGLCFGGLYLYGISQALPVDPIRCFAALAVLGLLGLGFGMINAVIGSFVFSWNYLYGIMVRGLILFSAVLFVLDFVAKPMREIVVYNPLAHAITWFRSGLYSAYPTMTLDVSYLLSCAAGLVVFAGLIQASTREWRTTR